MIQFSESDKAAIRLALFQYFQHDFRAAMWGMAIHMDSDGEGAETATDLIIGTMEDAGVFANGD